MIDAYQWYDEHGWRGPVAKAKTELEDRTGETIEDEEIAELAQMYDHRQGLETTDREQEIEDLRDTIAWYDRKDGWESAQESAEARLDQLTNG